MTWMEFTLALLDTCLWPGILLAAIILLKKPLSQLIPTASKLKFKDVEVEFGKELASLSKEAQDAFPEISPNRRNSILSMAYASPSAAILEAFDEVIQSAKTLIRHSEPSAVFDEKKPYKDIETTLIKTGVLDAKKEKIFTELRCLRNKVAHARSFDVQQAQAEHYIELCYVLIHFFESQR